MKALATDAIFLIVVIGLIVGTALIIFWKWFAAAGMQANEIACRTKLQNFCMDWINGKKGNWNDIEPKTGCEKFDISEPENVDKCKELFPS